MKLLFVMIFCLIINYNLSAWAQEQNMAKAKQEGKDIATTTQSKAQDLVKIDLNKSNLGAPSIGDIINYKGIDLPETQYKNGAMADVARLKSKEDSFEAGQIASTSFLRQKEYKINYKDSFLDKAHHAQAQPEIYIDWLDGKYKDCKQEGNQKLLSKEQVVCDEYQEVRNQTCSIGQNIEVNAKHNYQCIRKINKFSKKCFKTLNILVEEYDCDAGAIQQHITSLDIKYPYITIKLNNNYTGFLDGLSLAHFYISDISSIKELILDSVIHSNVFELSINNNKIYECHDRYYYDQDGQPKEDLRKTIISKDILKYVRSGLNLITWYSKPKYLSNNKNIITFKTIQRCFKEIEHWNEICNEIEEKL